MFMKKQLLILGMWLITLSLAAQEKPNIVYILVDNWGWGDISIQGSTVQTPRIDHFASEAGLSR
jgi:hypothetical protein